LESQGAPDFGAALKAASKRPEAKPPAPARDARDASESSMRDRARNSRKDHSGGGGEEVSQESSPNDSENAETPAPAPQGSKENVHQDDDAETGVEKQPAADDSQDDPGTNGPLIAAAATPAAPVANAAAQVQEVPQAKAPAVAANATASPVRAAPGLNVAGGLAQSLHLIHLAQAAADPAPSAPAAAPAVDKKPAAPSPADPAEGALKKGQPMVAPVSAPAERPPHWSPTASVQGQNEPAPAAVTPRSAPRGGDQGGGSGKEEGKGFSQPENPMGQALASAMASMGAGSAESGGSSTTAAHSVAPAAPEAPAKADSPAVVGTPVPAAPLTSAAGGAESTAAAQDSPSSDGQSTFDQIVLGLRGKLDAKSGKADIRLEPPNLGSVRVSVSLENGALTAQFQSSSDAVRSLLKDNLEKLKSVLQSQGVTVDKLAVDSPDAVAPAAAQQSNQQASFGSASHDGRSAGEYRQDPRSQQRRPAEGESFSRALRATSEAPVDMVA
jgi:flagellar hook-length control protein FliK